MCMYIYIPIFGERDRKKERGKNLLEWLIGRYGPTSPTMTVY